MKLTPHSFVLVLIPSLHADVFYVDASSPDGDGSSWLQALPSLQDAITAAVSGDEIRVAPGTYKPGTERADSFTLPAGVKITGGWRGNVRILDPEANGTILSGDLQDDGTLAGNNYHVIDGLSSDQDSLLDGFTITGGNSDAESPNDRGGGITLGAASPKLRNLRFLGNRAKFGGGLHTNRPDPGAELINVSFLQNKADIAGGGGGAIYLTNSADLTFTNCLFANNSAVRSGVMNGFTSDPLFINCTFANNQSDTLGGALYGTNGTNPTLINCIFWGNTAGTGTQIQTNTITENSSNNLIEGGYAARPEAVISAEDPRFLFTNRYILTSNSPALNVGLDSANSTETDLADHPRKVGIIDLGAYELPSSAPDLVVTTLADEDDGSLEGGAGVSLREAILYGNQSLIRLPESAEEGTLTLSGGALLIERDLSIEPFQGSAGIVIDGNDMSRHFIIRNSAKVQLQSLTLINGHAPDGRESNRRGESGGSIHISGQSQVSLSACRLSENQAGNGWTAEGDGSTDLGGGASGHGGAVYCVDSVLFFSACEISRNRAGDAGSSVGPTQGSSPGGDGGGVFADLLSTLEISESQILDNQAGDGGGVTGDRVAGSGGRAGGILSANGYLTVSNCLVQGNTAGNGASVGAAGFAGDAGLGGGLVIIQHSANVTRCEFRGNRTGRGGDSGSLIRPGRGRDGGGIFSLSVPRLTISACSFFDNMTGPNGSGTTTRFSGSGGAIAMTGEGTQKQYAEIFDCLFSGNAANQLGGALDVRSDVEVLARNCTFDGNRASIVPLRAGGGGAVSVTSGGILTLEYCTITRNEAPSGLAGGCALQTNGRLIDGETLYDATLNIKSSIISGNTGGDLLGIAGSTVTNAILISNGKNLIGTGNDLLTLIDEGDQTGVTAPRLARLGDYGGLLPTAPPLMGSPAIDTGGYSTLRFDQRGFPRTIGSATDVGAVEYAVIGTSTPQSLWQYDADGDGLGWGAEQALGSDPLDSSSGLDGKFYIEPGISNNEIIPILRLEKSASAINGTIWRVLRTQDLQNFDEIYNDRSSGSVNFPQTNFQSQGRFFFVFEAGYDAK